MTVDICGAVSFLKENDNFTILTHGHPDGDALGSGYGLCLALRAMGKKANVVCNDPIPKKFGYLVVPDEQFEEQTVVAVDIADTQLLGSKVKEKYEQRVELCIDHHGSNRSYAERTLLDADAAAASEIIFSVIKELGVEVSPEIADCLYTGIATDTGCFRYANVTPQTHIMAAELMELGADASRINVAMFETKTRTYAALEKMVLDSMEFFFDGRCAFITITQEMFRQSGSDESECDAIAALSRQVEGVLVGVTMRERSDGSFKASMRSHDPINVAEICATLGGGGHKNAAGCQPKGSLEQAKQALLKAIGEAI